MDNQIEENSTNEEQEYFLRPKPVHNSDKPNNNIDLNYPHQPNILNNDSTFALYSTSASQLQNHPSSANNAPAQMNLNGISVGGTASCALSQNNVISSQVNTFDYNSNRSPSNHNNRHSFPADLKINANGPPNLNFISSPIRPYHYRHQAVHNAITRSSYQLQHQQQQQNADGNFTNAYLSSTAILQQALPSSPIPSGAPGPSIAPGFLDLKLQPQFSSNNTNGIILQPNSTPPTFQQQFPMTFDPRGASNMPHKEKVNNWISKVPTYCLADGQFWHNECYPGVISPSSSINSSSESYEGLDFLHYNNSNNQHIVSGFEGDGQQQEQQNQKPQLYVDHEDVLEFQARKITKYVKKLYEMDRSEQVIKGDYSEELDEGEHDERSTPNQLHNLLDHGMIQIGDKSHNYSIEDSANLEITNTSYNLKLTEVFDQINNRVNNYNVLDDIDKFIAPKPPVKPPGFNPADAFEDIKYINNKTSTPIRKIDPYSKI